MAHLDGAIYHALLSSGNASQYVNLKSHLAFLKLVPPPSAGESGSALLAIFKVLLCQFKTILMLPLCGRGHVNGSELKCDLSNKFY